MNYRASLKLRRLLAPLLFVALLSPAAAPQANVQGQWTMLSPTMPINPIHVALLTNGKVLVVAGSGNCPPSQSGCPSGSPYGPSNGSGALLLDPVSGQTLAQFSVNWDMFCNAMVLLEDGRALVDGGTIRYDPFYGQPQASIFDSSTNTFSNTQNMAHGRWYPTLLTLGDGRVMTFSGLDENGNTNTSVEFYTIGSGWNTQSSASWTPDLYPRLHLLPNGKVFYSGAQTTSKLFDPATGTWNTNVATTMYTGTRTYGTSVLLPLTPANGYDPKVIIMGGGNPATNTTEIIDMGASTPGWQYGPNMSQARIEMNAVILPNGKVLAVGGSVNDEDTASASYNADLYDPVSNSFSSASQAALTDNCPTNVFPNCTRLYHSVALLLPDATVWLAGGNPSRGTYTQQMEIYKPAYLCADATCATPTNRPIISSAPSSISYGNTFTVTTPNAANVSSVVLVRNGAATHAFGMDQREVGLSFTVASGALTATAPPNGNIAPPGYYMLFILDSSGVPSTASFVQLSSAPDFVVTSTPASQTVAPAGGTSYAVNVTASGGFAGSVSFSVGGLPSGASATFTPLSVAGSGSSTMAVSTSSSTPSATYTLTITATSGALTHSVQVKLIVADFTITASPISQTVNRSSTTTYSVMIAANGPFSSGVNLSISGLASRNGTASFSPASVVGSGNSTLTVSTKRNAATGTYTLTITGNGGGLSHSTSVTLVVQ